jgi:hypothetical protein
MMSAAPLPAEPCETAGRWGFSISTLAVAQKPVVLRLFHWLNQSKINWCDELLGRARICLAQRLLWDGAASPASRTSLPSIATARRLAVFNVREAGRG